MKRAHLFRIAVILPATVALTGCKTLYEDQRNAEMRRRTEVGNMEAKIERLQERVEGMGTAQEDLFRRMDSLRTAMENGQRDQENRMAELSREVTATAAAREQLKKELVTGLSQQIVGVMDRHKPAATSRQSGYEHVVESGQTISEIAAAYAVTVQAIVKANGLSNPNQIRVGQKLFIPE